MALTVYTFNQLVTNMITAISSQTTKLTNFAVGSITLAYVQAVASNSLLLQQLITQLYAVTRLATSTGSDVDSFINDFFMTRLPAVPSTGLLTLTRTSTSTALSVSLTSANKAQTIQNQVQFQLIADTSQTSYDPITNAYIFPIGVASITATAQAAVAGAAGNVAAGTIVQVVSGFVGVNSVTNNTPSAGGADQESDAAVRARFPIYLGSFKTANLASIEEAIESVQTGLSFKIVEYQTFAGVPTPAYFTVVVDDGTGSISSSLLAAISVNVNAARAAGSQYEVDRPTNIPINVTLTVVPATGYSQAAVRTAVTTSVTAYINGLGVGTTVSLVNMANVIQTTAGVFSYFNLTINGVEADFTILPTQLAQVGSVAFV